MKRFRASRVLTAAAVGVSAMLLTGTPAGADVPVSLSDIRVSDSGLTATLVVRSDGEAAAIDPSSVAVTVGGQPAEASVEQSARVRRATMLVIDTSGSMTASGMATVRTAVRDFLAVVPDDVEVGVVSFATTSGVDVEPTTDHNAVLRAVGALRSDGETALYKAVQDAVRGLGTEGERSIVLLSDGGDTVAAAGGGRAAANGERQKALDALTRAKVRAEAVSFQSDDSNTDVLEQFADAGGGTVATADNPDAVSQAFEAAARTLDAQSVLRVVRPGGVTGSQPVTVEGTAGGEPFEVSAAIDLGDTAPPVVDGEGGNGAVQAAIGPSGPLSAVSLPLLATATGVVFIGVFVLGLALAAPTFKSRRSERIEAVEAYGYGTSRAAQRAQQQSTTAISQQLISMGDRVMEGRESTTKTVELLQRADLPWRAGEWLVLRLLTVVGLVAAGTLLAGDQRIFGAIGGLVLGILLPPVALRYLARRRARRFEVILPDVMMLVATSLASGFSLLQALDSVARDAPEPAAKEISRALAQARLGSDVGDALDGVAQRMDSHNMSWTTMAIRIQREVGGNLAETLRTTAATLREREMLQRQVKALSAEGRLSAYILIALPIGVFFFSMFSNYDYISLLWTRLLGIGMSGIGILSMVIGIFWMRNVVKIEV